MLKTALQKLSESNNEGKYICVGLDTDINKLPKHFPKTLQSMLQFNLALIKSTSENAAAYKLNFAFYETYGVEGFEILKETINAIPENIMIIGDAKRGDIGNTSQMYAKSMFEYFNCDSITVNPYMGTDSIEPFLSDKTKLVFILALTSNPGSNDFEKLKLESGKYLFQEVIEKVHKWNVNDNCGIVFGATNTSELEANMNLIKELPVLLPGIGAQGGDLNAAVKAFKNNSRKNYLINVSRGIIYKSDNEDFAEAASIELLKYNAQIQQVLKS